MSVKKEEVKKEEVNTVESQPEELRNDRLVTIKLFKDNGKYRDPVFVCVNDKRMLIQRGVEVRVPWYIADVLKNSMEQDQATANMIAMLADDYESKSKHLN